VGAHGYRNDLGSSTAEGQAEEEGDPATGPVTSPRGICHDEVVQRRDGCMAGILVLTFSALLQRRSRA
jgi:hypothetical protein